MAYWNAYGQRILQILHHRPVMSWIDRWNSKFGRYAIPNLTVVLIVGQAIAYLASAAPGAEGASVLGNIDLVPAKVVAGEWWRLITFLFAPPPTNAIFAFFYWYLFYLMGTTLEAEWGAFRYNVFLLFGYFASVAMAFFAGAIWAAPGQAAANGFLYGTVFLAFARLYPDFVINIFFILPVKIRWLAMFTWIIYGVTVLFAPLSMQSAMVVAAVFNYLVFFGRDILRDMQHGHRRMQLQARSLQGKGARRKLEHKCRVCGLSSVDSPKTAFRYCTECGDDVCYCPEHLRNHEHLVVAGKK